MAFIIDSQLQTHGICGCEVMEALTKAMAKCLGLNLDQDESFRQFLRSGHSSV